MRRLAAAIVLTLLTACGSDVVREGRVNVPVSTVDTLVMTGSSLTVTDLGVTVAVENTTAEGVFLEPSAFWYRPDGNAPNINAGWSFYGVNESTCPSAPVRPGGSRSCFLVFKWAEPQSRGDVVPATVSFSEAGTWIGGSARVESLD